MPAGRQLSPRNQRFGMIPPNASGIYVVELGAGVVKVGRSTDMRQRLIALQCEENRNGHALGRYVLYHGRYRDEEICIAAVAQHADPLPGRAEYFSGIAFDRACAIVAAALCGELKAA